MHYPDGLIPNMSSQYCARCCRKLCVCVKFVPDSVSTVELTTSKRKNESVSPDEPTTKQKKTSSLIKFEGDDKSTSKIGIGWNWHVWANVFNPANPKSWCVNIRKDHKDTKKYPNGVGATLNLKMLRKLRVSLALLDQYMTENNHMTE